MKTRTTGTLVLLLGLALSASGCAVMAVGAAGAGAGIGTYSYIDGKLQRSYDASLQDVWSATLAAVDQLRLKTEVSKQDAFGGRIEGEMYDGKNVVIELTRKDQRTRVGIRVGWIGDRERSAYIHDTIATKLAPAGQARLKSGYGVTSSAMLMSPRWR